MPAPWAGAIYASGRGGDAGSSGAVNVGALFAAAALAGVLDQATKRLAVRHLTAPEA